ncbi:MAG: tryptophan synthase subunit alpha [Candidatus Limnocylindria bacterium]
MSRLRGPSAVRAVFDAARQDGRAALVAYLMAGYPDEETSVEAAASAIDAGADLLEIGIPFSDPVADGPVIAEAGRQVLASGGGFDSAVRCIAALRERGYQAPILAMSYINPLLAGGTSTTLGALASSGADGLIVPDLPTGEEPGLESLAADLDLALCFLVAPNTPATRIEAAIRASTGFLYVVPLFGVTGARDRLPTEALPLLKRIRRQVADRVPVGAGFGISRPEHVATLAPATDGIIVGSALVAALGDGGDAGPQRVRSLVASLATTTPAGSYR